MLSNHNIKSTLLFTGYYIIKVYTVGFENLIFISFLLRVIKNVQNGKCIIERAIDIKQRIVIVNIFDIESNPIFVLCCTCDLFPNANLKQYAPIQTIRVIMTYFLSQFFFVLFVSGDKSK